MLVALFQMPALQQSMLESAGLVHTSDGRGMPVSYDTIDGLFPLTFNIRGLRIVDPVGRTVSSGTAHVWTGPMALFSGNVEVSDVHLVRSMATTGDNSYIEENKLYTDAERQMSIREAERRTRRELWPNLPRGLTIHHLLWEDFSVPDVLGNRTFCIEGSIDLRPNGGDFRVQLEVGETTAEMPEQRRINVTVDARGIRSTYIVTSEVTLRNTSVLCTQRPDSCHLPFNLSGVFAGLYEPVQLESRANIHLTTTGTYTNLLNAAFPSKNYTSSTALLSGTLSVEAHHPRALVSSAVVMFRVEPTRALSVDEARVRSPLLAQTGAFVFNCTVERPTHGGLLLRQLAVSEQRVILPLPLGEMDVAFTLDSSGAGSALMRKYDPLLGDTPWLLTTSFSSNVSLATKLQVQFNFNTIRLDVALGHMAGAGTIGYSDEDGLRTRIRLVDSEHQLESTLSVEPYRTVDLHPPHHRAYMLRIHLAEREVMFRTLAMRDLNLHADVLGLPNDPYGTLEVQFGSVNYGDGMFVMNNATIAAARDTTTTSAARHGNNVTTPWEFTASSDRDLRTRFTLFLVGSGDNEFAGSVSPFEAQLYGDHRIWTTTDSQLRFNYREATYRIQCVFHANQVQPDRESLQVFLDNQRLRLLLNDESYLLDPLVSRHALRSVGVLQGYAELDDPLHAMTLGQVDLCWNNGELYRRGYDAVPETIIAKQIYGCLRGGPLGGWRVNEPPATVWITTPEVGRCELRANVTASRKDTDTLDVPVSLQLRLLDTGDSPWLQEGWVDTQVRLAIKI